MSYTNGKHGGSGGDDKRRNSTFNYIAVQTRDDGHVESHLSPRSTHPPPRYDDLDDKKAASAFDDGEINTFLLTANGSQTPSRKLSAGQGQCQHIHKGYLFCC